MGDKTLLMNIVAVAGDTDLRGGIRSGSILLDEITVAGS